MPKQNLYRVLNVPQNASTDELKKAINKELRLWSNRTNAPQIERRQEAERMVKLLEQAEAILLDPGQRAAYDRQLAFAPAEQREVGEGDLSGGIDLVQEARRLLIEGNIADALFVAEKATQCDGNNAEAWAVLGESRFRWGDTEDAIYEYKRAIKLRPNEATYYFDFGSVLESADRPADALQQYQRAAQIDPGTTMYRAAVGSVLVKHEQYADGIQVLEQCVREQPDNPTYQWFLAIAYSESAILGWTHIGQGHPLLEEGVYATEFEHITDAQTCLNKAMSLKFDDADLMAQLQQRRQRIDEMLKRKIMCNWVVAVIVGLIGIPMLFIPTVLAILYVISSSTPQYRINKRLVQGKHFNEFAFIAEAFGGGNVGCVGVLFMYAFIIIAMPFVVAINFYRNWLSVPSVKTAPVRYGSGGTIAPVASGPTGMDTIILQLKLLGTGVQQAFLRLYCPMRRKREAGAEGSWLLLALLPPAGIFLVGLVLTLAAKGVGITVIAAGVLYAIFIAYVSLIGPTVQDAEARLAAVRARRQELRGREPTPTSTPGSAAGGNGSSPPPLPAQARSDEPKCSRCKQRLPRNICGHRASPCCGQHVEPTHVCPQFELNPAQDYYVAALAGIINENQTCETNAKMLETAIRMGLPEDDDVQARRFLASSYQYMAVQRGDSFGPLFSEANKQLEYAIQVDSERGYGVFQASNANAMLFRFDLGYKIEADSINEKNGAQAAIAYLEEKVRLFGRVPGDPMMRVLLSLGLLYYTARKDRQKSRECLQRVLRAQPIPDPECQADQRELKEKAQSALVSISQ